MQPSASGRPFASLSLAMSLIKIINFITATYRELGNFYELSAGERVKVKAKELRKEPRRAQETRASDKFDQHRAWPSPLIIRIQKSIRFHCV